MNEENRSTPVPTTRNPREAAYLALLAAFREERFVTDTLELWQIAKPSDRDIHLAQELSFGICRLLLSLQFMAEQLAPKKKLTLKLKERLLLYMALYQYYYLERIPLYAIVNETMNLAKKYCHANFTSFLNGMLRNLPEESPKLPQGNAVTDLSVHYSYPPYLVELLIKDYGINKAKEIMEMGNKPSQTMVRLRLQTSLSDDRLETICETPFKIGRIKSSSDISFFSQTNQAYIQNATPASLIGMLSQGIPCPRRILDLCASPGGKLLAIHDLFPEAALFANDISQEKMQRLSENCKKYNIDPTLTCGPGEEYSSQEQFDLIILDVPCSNTGVLNKRPEARWRVNEESLKALTNAQFNLINKAKSLLTQHGEIWLMTCSILRRENEEIVKNVCEDLGLSVRCEERILPNSDGWDGGYACALLTEPLGGGPNQLPRLHQEVT